MLFGAWGSWHRLRRRRNWAQQHLQTQAYVLQFNTVILLAGFSMGLAAEILVGRLLGEGNLREAHGLVKRVTWMSLAISGAVSVVVALAWSMACSAID